MKSRSYRNPSAPRTADSKPVVHRSTRERGMHAVTARPPPAVHHRRYPSLSDDGQPYFPRLSRARRNADENVTTISLTYENEPWPFFLVRAFAFVAIIVIIAALIALM